jgi:hypothetical protein
MVSIVLHEMSRFARHDGVVGEKMFCRHVERRETSAFKSVKVELDER